MPNPSSNALLHTSRAPLVRAGIAKPLPFQLRLFDRLDTGIEIELNPATHGSPFLGFMPMPWVWCTLPMAKGSTTATTFVRQTPWIRVTAHSALPLPYGSTPRILIALVVTKALKENSHRFRLAHGISDLAAQMGNRNPNGRELRLLFEQCRRVQALTWHLEHLDAAKMVSKAESWNLLHSSQISIGSVEIEISADMLTALKERRVMPLDLRALIALKQSPFALDLLMWLSSKAPFLETTAAIKFGWIMQQFGTGLDPSNGQHRKKFGTHLRAALYKVAQVWPRLKATIDHGSLFVSNSPPPVPQKE